MEFLISQPKVVRLPRNEKQTYRLNSRPQMWPMVWIYQIVTGVTSVVGVPSTHLVVLCGYISVIVQFIHTVYPNKYAHGFCFAVLCCGYTLTDLPISIRLTSLALWQSNDCPSASKATLMNMDKYFMWIHYERLHNHNKTKHNKTVCIFLGIYCIVRHEVSRQPLRCWPLIHQ